jgi:hypothetical protein
MPNRSVTSVLKMRAVATWPQPRNEHFSTNRSELLTFLLRLVRPAEARDRRSDYLESDVGIGAVKMGRRIRKHGDHFVEFEHIAGPTVDDEQWDDLLVLACRRLSVNEMDLK